MPAAPGLRGGSLALLLLVSGGFHAEGFLPPGGRLSLPALRPRATTRVHAWPSFFNDPKKGDKKPEEPPADKPATRYSFTAKPGTKPKGPLRPTLGNAGKPNPTTTTAAASSPKTVTSAGDPADGPLERAREVFSAVTSKLQTPVIDVWGILAKTAIFTVGFFGGAGAGIYFLLSPSSILPENVAQPITLFENILLEIDRGYVEKVDEKRLFQAAVDSMLSTLDPYTEFEGEQLAKDMRESVSGRYGGVGLIIAGSKVSAPTPDTATATESVAPEAAESSPISPISQADDSSGVKSGNGITVVSAFEGYAFDAGMRVGDRVIAVDDIPVAGRSVDQVRDLLRGPPETQVRIRFERPGVDTGGKGMELTLTRHLVRVPDVKLTTFLGQKDEGIGYIQLQGFSVGAPNELRRSIEVLRSHSPNGLKGLILDLRGNPGGLLSSAVDVASLIIPKGSPIVSAMGRNFDPVSYSSSLDPVRDASVPLAILVNSNTASAAEIVSGAVQDLDVGVIVGADRTYGKGLVQNVESLPYNTALKYTVAKYYTPSGRCIQSVKYSRKEDGAPSTTAKIRSIRQEAGYQASEVPDSERKTFLTKHGRVVRDGGGIEADVKVKAVESSVLEVTLQQQGAFFDYANEWVKTHKFSDLGDKEQLVSDKVYEDFQRFVARQVDKGNLKVDLIFSGSLDPLDEVIKEIKYTKAKADLDALKKVLTAEVEDEFKTHAPQIRERIQDAILARYLPESMLRRIALQNDPQVKTAIETIKDQAKYQSLLAGSARESGDVMGAIASSPLPPNPSPS